MVNVSGYLTITTPEPPSPPLPKFPPSEIPPPPPPLPVFVLPTPPVLLEFVPFPPILLPPVPEYLLKTLSFVFAASTFNTKNCSLPKERISFGAIFSRFVISGPTTEIEVTIPVCPVVPIPVDKE